ncbi:MAG: hypothetical protein Q7K40_00460, partial [bacterium]|nr:hypothetical protein [bacterium]
KNVTGVVIACLVIEKSTRRKWFASMSIGNVGIVTGSCSTCAKHAAEKIDRLLQRREYGNSDVASSQSADEKNPDRSLRTYGGAIVFESESHLRYLSISAAPSIVDEVAVLVIGNDLGFDRPERYQNRLEKRAHQLYDSFQKEPSKTAGE